MILFILPLFSGGGAERVVLNLLTELNKTNDVGIIVFNKLGPLITLVPDDVTIYSLKKSSLRSAIIPLINKIRQLNPKVIFSTLGYVNIAILSIRWILPKNIKIWIREANLPSISIINNQYPRLITFLYKFFYRKADKLICSSKKMKSEFILNFSIPRERMEILPNPVDVNIIQTLSLPVERFDMGGICYVAAGRLTFQKGFDRLLHWFKKLNNKQSTLTILGDGLIKEKLIKEAKLLNIYDRINFVGFCNNPWTWYAGADAFLLSSRWEGMPNSALEALVCGTPVIATKESGGISELVDQSENHSIIIASNDKKFIYAMENIKSKHKTSRLNCFLPNSYRKENVASIVKGWLDEIK